MTQTGICPIGKVDRILLSTDRTEFSEGAVREAINFAQRCSSILFIITVIEMNPEYATIGASLLEAEEEEAHKYLDSIKARTLKEGVRCEMAVCTDNEPFQCIVREASKRRADMIVTGKRGTRGLKKLMMGDVASKVIGYAPCKVLVVPREARIQFRNILVATDGSKHSEAAAAEAIGIAKRCGSAVIALSSISSEDQRKEAQANVTRVLEMGRREGLEVETLTPRGKPYEVIVEVAGGRAVDLIVVGTYGRTALERLLMGSTTERVVGLAQCAVLVVKAAEEEK